MYGRPQGPDVPLSLKHDKVEEIPAGPIGEAPAVEEPDTRHIYLWDEGNMPTITEYTVNNGNYQDDPDFRPNIVWYPVPEGTAVKGAVMVCPGGAFIFRSGNEGPFYRQFNQNVEAVRHIPLLSFLLAQLFFQKPDASGQFFNRRQLVLNFPNPDIVV